MQYLCKIYAILQFLNLLLQPSHETLATFFFKHLKRLKHTLTKYAPSNSFASSSTSALYGHACDMVAATGCGHTELAAVDLTLWNHNAPPLLPGAIAPPGATRLLRDAARTGLAAASDGPSGGRLAVGAAGPSELAVARGEHVGKPSGGAGERSQRRSRQCSGSGRSIRWTSYP